MPIPMDELLEQARLLSLADLVHLLELLAADLRRRIERQQYYGITELRGVGKESWQEIDVEKYIENERSSWE